MTRGLLDSGLVHKGAQKRIRQLIKQRKDRDDQISLLIKNNEELNGRLSTREQEFNSINKLHLDANEKQITDKLELARAAYKSAHDEGDTGKILQAQEFLNEAQNDLKALGATKAQFEQQPQEQVQQPQQQYAPPQGAADPKAVEWSQNNDWFGKDRVMTAAALALDSELKEFIDAIIRHNSIDTYLNTFVNGIKSFTNESSLLHPKFMQAVTATARLSSRDPNFQNQPRGKTFPIRKVVDSRFEGGSILEIDFAQLEFRTAVFLAQDKQGMEDIKNKIDVHAYTAKIIGVSRQDAKAHTFKPLYGGTTGTEEEKRYYKKFAEKYKDITAWHGRLQTEAIKLKVLKLPTGREYAFPYAERMPWGGSSYSTQIKNYPVQGFATADIVPLACIKIYELMKEQKVKSLLINTVHDSIVADVYPGEEAVMGKIFKQGTASVIPALKEYYGINFNIPLDTDLKMGYNWLDIKEI